MKVLKLIVGSADMIALYLPISQKLLNVGRDLDGIIGSTRLDNQYLRRSTRVLTFSSLEYKFDFSNISFPLDIITIKRNSEPKKKAG